jgi:hypothetical protein
VLPLLLLSLAIPNTVLSQSAAPGPSELAPEARARLDQAAGDSGLAPWQRDLMLRLARTRSVAAANSATADAHTESPALSSDVADGAWEELVVSSRQGHSAIYDPVRDRVVAFGGSGVGPLNDVWALALAGTPAWKRLTPTGTPPSARSQHSAIYDPVRDLMIVFGGQGSSTFNDVWTLSLGGTPAWTQLTPTGTPPGARYAHSAIYDPLRDRMVVFGGHGPGTFNDVWALSLGDAPTWTQLSPAGAPPGTRAWHSSIYDPVRDRMVVFGGYGSGSIVNDVWALSLAGTSAWSKLTATGLPPSARETHTATYDPVRDRMVVFGGYSPSIRNDIWSLSLTATPAWTELTPTGTLPSARAGHCAIYDPLRDRLVLFGGEDGSHVPSNDVWALSLPDVPAWTQLTPTDTPPSARYLHDAIHDPVRDRMLVFGGHHTSTLGSGSLNDVWGLSLGGVPAWTHLAPTSAPPCTREAHSAIYDPLRERMVLFGGWSPDSGNLNDVWALSLAGTPAWTQLTPTGPSPGVRYSHSAIYDPVSDRMVVFGGYGSGLLNDVWALSLSDTPAWTRLTPTGTPPIARCEHSAIYDPVRDCMVVFGGRGPGCLDDVWSLSLSGAPAWTKLTPTGTLPSARYGHSAIHDTARDRMVVFGGFGASYPYHLDGVWALSLSGTPEWTQLAPTRTPPIARSQHSAICDPVRGRMVVFGGSSGGPDLDDVWALGWSTTAAVSKPTALPLISGLWPPAPNPTRGRTSICFALAQAGHVQLGVYDVAGRLVRTIVDCERPAGAETAVWNGTDESGARLGAGVYFVRLAGPGLRKARRVILLR